MNFKEILLGFYILTSGYLLVLGMLRFRYLLEPFFFFFKFLEKLAQCIWAIVVSFGQFIKFSSLLSVFSFYKPLLKNFCDWISNDTHTHTSFIKINSMGLLWDVHNVKGIRR